MATADSVLHELCAATGFVSGEALALKAGVSRAAVSKAIDKIRQQGIGVTAKHRLGYKLEEGCDPLYALGIETALDASEEPLECRIMVKADTRSTNEDVAAMAKDGAPEFTCVVADHQALGKGRRGKAFFSPAGSGLYLSILTRPGASMREPVMLTCISALSLCRAAKSTCGVDASIKWVNDILVGEKKAAGILTEAHMDLESSCVEYAVSGIGVNVYRPEEGFPPELEGSAAFLADEKRTGLRNALAAEIIGQFAHLYRTYDKAALLAEYRSLCSTCGKHIEVHDGSLGRYEATALSVNDDLSLLVRLGDGTVRNLHNADLSIRPGAQTP